jgi:glutathione S-transferase
MSACIVALGSLLSASGVVGQVREFFFGSKPTTLDALAYGYLSVLMHVHDGAEGGPLSTVASGNEALKSYVKRIAQRIK